MQHALCTVPAAPLRAEPAHRSEMTSQFLFGETMDILKSEGEWYFERSSYDGYEGWLTHHLVTLLDNNIECKEPLFVSTGLLNPVTLPDQLLNLPMGSSLTGFDEETRLLWDGNFKYHGTYRNTTLPFTQDLFWNTLLPWRNAPYLWGGKTFMGVDCSGFVQTVFKIMGIALPRDACQQATVGDELTNREQTTLGDLAFFTNEKGRITHVGIVLPDDKIIHASGKVRIDILTSEGIISRDTGKHTHSLHSIKRVIQW